MYADGGFSEHPAGVNFVIFDIPARASASPSSCTGHRAGRHRGGWGGVYPGNGVVRHGADPGGYPWYGSGSGCQWGFTAGLAVSVVLSGDSLQIWRFWWFSVGFTADLEVFPV